MRYFVTGASGFIGGALTRRLLRDGQQVVAVVRKPDQAQQLAELGVELHQGDITDKESMRAAMTGTDGVFHLAAWYKIGVDPSRAEQINVGGTRNVLELMKELGIVKGVYTSTLAVFSDTGGATVDEHYRHDPASGFLSEYDRTKYLAHYQVAQPLIDEGLPLVIVQPGLVYGPDDRSAAGDAIRRYLKKELPMLIKGSAYTWAYLDDVVEGHILAMDRGVAGESYIIAGPIHTLIDAFETAERLSGVRAPRTRLAPGLVKGMAGMAGFLSRFMTLSGDYHPEALRVSAGATYLGDNGKARREFGYAPRPLEEGLAATLRHEMTQLGMALPPALADPPAGDPT